LLENLEPLRVSTHVDLKEDDHDDEDMLESNHGCQGVFGVLLAQFEPGEEGVDLVGGVAAEPDVGENAGVGEEVKGVLPYSNIHSLADEGTSGVPSQCKHVVFGLKVDEQASQSSSEGEGSSKHRDVSEGHDHLQVLIEHLNFVFIQLCDLLGHYIFKPSLPFILSDDRVFGHIIVRAEAIFTIILVDRLAASQLLSKSVLCIRKLSLKLFRHFIFVLG